jgi:hypothetical protein
MITIIIVCDRCSNTIEEDLSNMSFKGEDIIRQAGFQYIHANKQNMLICNGCFNKFKELKGMQEEKAYNEVCKFFKICEKEEDGENRGGEENERI